MSVEAILLGVSFLFFLSILACKAGYRFGVPILLLFLAVGMVCGCDGLGIEFASNKTAQAIGTVALCVILFSGGMDTKVEDIKPVLWPGLTLATLGVILTTIFTGLLIKLTFYLLPPITTVSLSLTSAILLAAMMSSTDSASVFSILRGKGLKLKHGLRNLLELESGSNDPMAYMLTITLISLVQQGGSPDYVTAFFELIKQFLLGTVAGLVFGKLFIWIINHLKIANASLYPIAVFTSCIFIFSASYFLGGNSYLAIYIGGVVVGNSRFIHKRSSMNFFDGLAWLSQLCMFLTLGLLVTPHELVSVIAPALIVSILMIFFARPASVFLCLLPFKRYDTADRLFVSWVGLRGAVPIIFAIMALSAEVPHAQILFNTVFVCTLVSLIVQGTSLAWMADKLKLSNTKAKLGKVKDFDMEFSDDIKSILAELTISKQILNYGDKLLSLPLPENSLAVLLKRDGKYFVPTGNTDLKEDDKILLISDDEEGLTRALAQMGVTPESDEPQENDLIPFGQNMLNDLKDLGQQFKFSKLLKF